VVRKTKLVIPVPFTRYFESGFLGFWTTKGLKTFINGSLNVSRGAAAEYKEIVRSYPDGLSEEAQATLDDDEVDIFVGIAPPLVQSNHQRCRYATSRLESASDWILAFRSARSSVYLRCVNRNSENLNRIARYYARANVPFDRSRSCHGARRANARKATRRPYRAHGPRRVDSNVAARAANMLPPSN
jgi:hypothetical protein